MIKFMRFCLSEIKAQISENKSIFIIIVLTISLTLTSVFMLINILRESVSSIDEINQQKCIYYPNICIDLPWNEMKEKIRDISDFFDSNELPPLISYDYRIHLNYENNDTIITNDQEIVSVGLNIIPNTDDSNSLDAYEEVKREIIVGEMPNLYEKNDIPVILLGNETHKKFFSGNDIGNIIQIGDTQYIIAAIVSSDKNYVFGADLDASIESQFLIDTLIFSEPLTNAQRNYYHLILSKYKGSEDINLYEIRKFGEIMTYVTYCVVVVLLLLFCMITIIRLFRYVFTNRLYVYNIYKIHGINQNQLAIMLAFVILIITAVSSVLGVTLFYFSKPVQNYFYIYRELSTKIIASVIVVMLLLSVVTAFPTINRLAKRPPLDRTFWR